MAFAFLFSIFLFIESIVLFVGMYRLQKRLAAAEPINDDPKNARETDSLLQEPVSGPMLPPMYQDDPHMQYRTGATPVQQMNRLGDYQAADPLPPPEYSRHAIGEFEYDKQPL